MLSDCLHSVLNVGNYTIIVCISCTVGLCLTLSQVMIMYCGKHGLISPNKIAGIYTMNTQFQLNQRKLVYE